MVILLVLVGWMFLGLFGVYLAATIHVTMGLLEYSDDFVEWLTEKCKKARDDQYRKLGRKYKIALYYTWGLLIWPVRLVQYVKSIPEINKEFEDFWFGQNEEA